MKKLSLFTLIAVLFLGMNVYAMTESELKDKLTQTITVGSDKYSLSDGDKVLVERYLNENEVSSADADYINERINTVISIIQGQGNANFKNYPTSVKNQLKALVTEVSGNTSVKATVTNGSVIVYNGDGSTFAEITGLVKQTGSETSKTAIIAGISILIVAVGACLVIKQVKTSE